MDLAVARALAEQCGYEESLHSAPQGLIIFEAAESDSVVSVWYNSGTVAVAVPHPRRDHLASFFFGVSEEGLHKILSEPWYNDALHYSRPVRAVDRPKEIETEETAVRRQWTALELEEADIAAERLYLQRRLRELPKSAVRKPVLATSDSNVADLERRRRELAEEIKFLEHKKSKGEAELQQILYQKKHTIADSYRASSPGLSEPRYQLRASSGTPVKTQSASPNEPVSDDVKTEDLDAHEFRSQHSVNLGRSLSTIQRESPGRYRGNRCLYSFTNEDYQEEFAKAWSEKSVGSVALSRGYIIVYDDGGVAWWDIPDVLDHKFRDEHVKLPPIKFAALGPDDNYFVRFVNGKMEWVAKTSFERAMRRGVEDRSLYVERVALGPGGCWLILWGDGTADCEGLPADLAALIESSIRSGQRLREVSLGPSGEWFVIFADNSVQANNLSDSLHKALGNIKRAGGRVRTIVFGEANSWYIRYWDGH